MDALLNTLAELRERYHIPVLAVHLVDGTPASTTSKVFGAHASTPLRWGSITKTVTALSVLELAQQKRLALDQPLTAYVKATHWQNPWRATHPIRVIDSLEMRAGLPDLSAAEFAFNKPITLQQALALNPAHRTSLWPPGTQHVYSNMSAGLTQLLIEKVTRQPYAEAVAHLVLQPLGMRQAGFQPMDTLPGGFRADGTTEIPYWHMTFPAYGALNATLGDMAKLLRALQHPQQLPAATRQYLFTPHGRRWESQFNFDYAAGLYPRVRQGHVWHTHGGDADGYRSRLALLATPGGGGYVANINVDNPSALRHIERELELFLTQRLATPQPTPAVTLSAAQADTITGHYYPSGVRFGVEKWQQGAAQKIELQATEQQVAVRRRGSTTILYPIAPTLFRRAEDPVATVTIFAAQGTMYMQGELGNYKRLPGQIKSAP